MVSQKDRKSTQRERLVEGMMEVAVQDGYAAATVARVIAHAGVSRPTFYDYFEGRQACFLAVHRKLTAELVERFRMAIAREDPARSVSVAVATLVELAGAEPVAARFLLHETTAANTEALDERDGTIAELARIVEHALAQAPPREPTPDMFAPALIGGVYRLLALRLRRGERDLSPLADELERWLAAYERPTCEHRWRSLKDGPAPAASPPVGQTALYPPPPLPSGRMALTSEEVSYNHRERIMFACVRMACEKGYATTTIADIAAAAHVDRRVFYKHFRDKQEAYQAALEHVFQRSIAATATGFFSAPTWPERVWEAGHAFTQFLAYNPALTQFGFIDAYSIGPAAVRRFEDLRTAYTIFLQEGRQHAHDGVPAPTDTALEAIAATVFEVIYHEVRRGRTDRLTYLLPQVAHLCLTPVLGPEETDELVDSKLGESRVVA
jgi:AcrR family transcriptional regulator